MKRIAVLTLILALSFACLGGCLPGKLPLDKSDYRIEGIDDNTGLASYLNVVLKDNIEEKRENKPEDKAEARRRESYYEQKIKGDLSRALNAKGYYEAKVGYQDDNTPAAGTYQILQGPLYKISSIKVRPEKYARYFKGIDLKPESPLDAEKVLAAQAGLHQAIQENRCYFRLKVDNAVVLDKKNNAGSITFNIDAGPEASLGAVSFTGQENVKPSYLQKLVPWKNGDCFSLKKIEELQASLLESGLFAQAKSVLPEKPDRQNNVPVTFQLKERAPRSLRTGLSYYTDEGPGLTLGWEHRNVSGAAENFSAALTLSSLKQNLNLALIKPHFLRKNQSLSLTAAIENQNLDAYDQTGGKFGASISRKLGKFLSGSSGVLLNITKIREDSGDTSTYGLVSLPNSLSFDSRDKKLDPHKGWLLNGRVTPFFDALGESQPFFKMEGDASTYFALGTPYDLVLATRLSLGSILGGDIETIPATELFYAGGGGSVRGFGYQQISPRLGKDPTGGQSIVTGTMEMRAKFTPTLGGVIFTDAGNVSEGISPEMDHYGIGAGIGLRYYTSFGPLRFDIATPVVHKDDVDGRYEFYISIGQAF